MWTVLLTTWAGLALAQDAETPPAEETAPAEETPSTEEAAPAEGETGEAPAEEAPAEEAPAPAPAKDKVDEEMQKVEKDLAAIEQAAPTEQVSLMEGGEDGKADQHLSAELGFTYTAGNAEVLNAVGTLKYSVKADKNQFTLEAGANINYARTDTDGDGTVADTADDTDGDGEDDNPFSFQSQKIYGKLRYDRFFSDKDALYVKAGGQRDVPAGVEWRFDQGLGYHRDIVKTDATSFRFEVGAEFVEEDLVEGVDDTGVATNALSPDNVYLAGRLFFGVTHAFNDIVSISDDLEMIENLVSLQDPSASTPDDFRLYNTLTLSVKVTDILGLKVSDQLAFDNRPAAPDFSKVDNTVSLLLVATLL
ncbi:MAG: DUF481 domain-containing protein [Alphaproteobacteria bacterium]|nr:DUF481 domain-containing protein [Alphaproteobacteria bacterium]